MDHSSANLMTYQDIIETHIIELSFSHQNKMATLQQSESGMHHKEQQLQEEYYKQIGKEILKYDKILIFGPTNAKTELYNYITKDHHFDTIKFEIQNTNKMTKNEILQPIGQT